MSLDRRALLSRLGVASASSLLWALGCGGAPPPVAPTPERVSGEIRTWLRDAVARLAATFPSVHVLAVRRSRTATAADVLGAGVARASRAGAVLTVRDRDGQWREQVTSMLTLEGIAAAVRGLVGSSLSRAPLALGRPPPVTRAPTALDDGPLYDRLDAIRRSDSKLTSRIVYAASLIDIDDAQVWSISTVHDREQRLVRVRKRALRAAWNGSRPVFSEIERGWLGGVDDHELAPGDVEQATEDALLLLTPDAFEDRERAVILDPGVAASVIDAAVRARSTSAAALRPEVSARRAPLSRSLTITDDPAAAGAYGGFVFDDEGVPAAPIRLVDAGQPAGALAARGGGRARRPGHVGAVAAEPSHLRVTPGTIAHEALRDSGVILEGALGASVDPSSDRIVVGAARAREIRGGALTGRVHADVEIVGELSALLRAISGVAKDAVSVPYRDELDGEPRWRSVEAPHLLTRGYVRARRRRA